MISLKSKKTSKGYEVKIVEIMTLEKKQDVLAIIANKGLTIKKDKTEEMIIAVKA